MKLSRGVEWATHSCTVLAALPEDRELSAEALAEFYDLPSAYLAKQLQALRRGGIVQSSRGKGGGYRLARPANMISLLDIVRAIEGPEPAFRCSEIRQNGPCALKKADCKRPCEIAAAFGKAEQVFRDALAAQTLDSLISEFVSGATPAHLIDMAGWIKEKSG